MCLLKAMSPATAALHPPLPSPTPKEHQTIVNGEPYYGSHMDRIVYGGWMAEDLLPHPCSKNILLPWEQATEALAPGLSIFEDPHCLGCLDSRKAVLS